MRLLVFFDLPTQTKEDKKQYPNFRKFLLKDDYNMIQFSVYGRLLNNLGAKEKHYRRLQTKLPKQGSVFCLIVTEKEFAGMEFLANTDKNSEKIDPEEQLLLF